MNTLPSALHTSMPVLPLLPVLTIATFSDLKSRRIPNLLILIAILPGGFFLGQSFLLRLWFICLLCYPLFRLHLVGAGDVKLLAVIAAWSEPDSFLSFLFCSLLLAAIPHCSFCSGGGTPAFPWPPAFFSVSSAVRLPIFHSQQRNTIFFPHYTHSGGYHYAQSHGRR